MDARFTNMDVLTNLPKEIQGQMVFLSLPKNICECVGHLSIAGIGQAEGLITGKLD